MYLKALRGLMWNILDYSPIDSPSQREARRLQKDLDEYCYRLLDNSELKSKIKRKRRWSQVL